MIDNLLNKVMMNESRLVKKHGKRLNESVEFEDKIEPVLEKLEKILNDELASYSGVAVRVGHGDVDEADGSFKIDVVGYDAEAFDEEELQNFEDSVEGEIRDFFKKLDKDAVVIADPERDLTFQIVANLDGTVTESADNNKLHKLAEITKDFISNYPEIELSADLDDQGSGEYFLEFDFNADAFETETEKQEFENKLQQAIEDWSKTSGFTVNRSEDEDVQMAFWINECDESDVCEKCKKPVNECDCENLKEDTEEPEPIKFNYRLLGRLAQDCDYFLGAGGRNDKHLWAGSPEKQIAKMRELYDKFPEGKKPEWLSPEDIDNYEKQMIGECNDKNPIVEAVADFIEITDPMLGYVIPADLNDAFTQKDLSDGVARQKLDLRRVGDNFVVGEILEEKFDVEDLVAILSDFDYHVTKNDLTNLLDEIVDPEKAEKAGYGNESIRKDEIFEALGQPRWFIKK